MIVFRLGWGWNSLNFFLFGPGFVLLGLSKSFSLFWSVSWRLNELVLKAWSQLLDVNKKKNAIELKKGSLSGKVNFDTLLTFLTKSLYVENSHAFLCFTCILKGNTLNDKLKFPRFGVTLKYRETRVKGTSHICIDKKKEKKNTFRELY